MSKMFRPCVLASVGIVAALAAMSTAQAQATLRVPVVSRTIFYLPA